MWRVCSGLLAIAVAAVGIWLVRQLARLRSLAIGLRRPARVVVMPSLTIATLLLAANATVIPAGRTPAIYLTGLGLLMFLAGFVFALILFSFLGNVDSEP